MDSVGTIGKSRREMILAGVSCVRVSPVLCLETDLREQTSRCDPALQCQTGLHPCIQCFIESQEGLGWK